MIRKIKEFIFNEDGSELMQWAVILILAAVIITAAYAINNNIVGKVENAADVLATLP